MSRVQCKICQTLENMLSSVHTTKLIKLYLKSMDRVRMPHESCECCIPIYIVYITTDLLNAVRASARGAGGRGLIPNRVTPKT